ncbi:MAG: ankyrin repeat domain-containing protein [Candidatus Pacebacteria bacterium]|nr:ankyrin repeat domain-containing protein [Candidatus Paceibacterota bacterium]
MNNSTRQLIYWVDGLPGYDPEELIKKGADVNVIWDEENNEPLLSYATRLSLKNKVLFLLKKGAKKDVCGLYGGTLLHRVRDFSLAKLFVETLKLDVKVVDNYGCTPLHDIVSRGSNNKDILEIVELFLNNGADINALNHKGESPLFLACLKHDKEMAKRLLGYKGIKVFFHNNHISYDDMCEKMFLLALDCK